MEKVMVITQLNVCDFPKVTWLIRRLPVSQVRRKLWDVKWGYPGVTDCEHFSRKAQCLAFSEIRGQLKQSLEMGEKLKQTVR